MGCKGAGHMSGKGAELTIWVVRGRAGHMGGKG